MKNKVAIVVICCALLVGCSSSSVQIEQEGTVEPSTPQPLVPQPEMSEPDAVPVEVDENAELGEALEEELEASEQEQVVLIEKKDELPDGFVYLDEIVPHISLDVRYYSENNFVGTYIEGYNAPLAIGTVEMADAMRLVSEELYEQGYSLRIYDAYRPAKAVAYFKAWSSTEDIKMKEKYYPNEMKGELFKRGYLASKSGHSRGSTVDLTLVYLANDELVDMGSEYDILDEISSFNTKQITDEQRANRNLLKDIMEKHGFKSYSKEWWHYTLVNEPHRQTYFDFDVE